MAAWAGACRSLRQVRLLRRGAARARRSEGAATRAGAAAAAALGPEFSGWVKSGAGWPASYGAPACGASGHIGAWGLQGTPAKPSFGVSCRLALSQSAKAHAEFGARPAVQQRRACSVQRVGSHDLAAGWRWRRWFHRFFGPPSIASYTGRRSGLPQFPPNTLAHADVPGAGQAAVEQDQSDEYAEDPTVKLHCQIVVEGADRTRAIDARLHLNAKGAVNRSRKCGRRLVERRVQAHSVHLLKAGLAGRPRSDVLPAICDLVTMRFNCIELLSAERQANVLPGVVVGQGHPCTLR